MNLNSSRTLFLVVCSCAIAFSVRAQEQPIKETGVETIHLEMTAGINLPTTLGTNFVNSALRVKAGFTGELTLFFKEHYYLGYQGVFNTAEVEDSALVGLYDTSRFRHHYLIGGYSFFPKTRTIGLNAGIGLGHASYKNKKGNTVFFDNGFALSANTRATYRFSKHFGFYLGGQLSKDFLTIETAPQQKDFFKEARFFNVSFGMLVTVGG